MAKSDRIAVVAAAMQKRYDAMVTAMEQLHMEPVIIEDLVKFGEDRGFDRGFLRGIAMERVRMLEMRLGLELPPDERDQLVARVSNLSPIRFSEVLFQLSHAALGAWIADPNAT